MKMKKVAALLLTAVMSMSLLAGCGGSNNAAGTNNAATSNTADTTNEAGDAADTTEEAGDTAEAETTEVEQVKLKVWTPEEELEVTTQLCEAFDEAYPEYECEFEIAVSGVDEGINSLETDPDLAADVFQMPSGGISQLVDQGLIYPITANLDQVKSLYGEGAIKACTKDDLLYAVPVTPNSWFMYYNTDMYTEEDVKSLETMMSKDLGDGVQNFSCQVSNAWYTEAFFYAAGCTLYGADGTNPDDCTWNNEGGVAAANYIIDLVANPKYVEDLDGIAAALLKDGKLAAYCSGTWDAPMLKEALGDKLGAAALPTINLNGTDCQLSNFADYRCYAVKSNTAHPMAAQLLAEWLCNEESQLTRFTDAGVTPTCLSLAENAEVAADVASVALLEQTQFATPQPSISQINNYWTPVGALGTGIINGEITKDNIQENLDRVVTDVTSTLTE